MLLAAWLAGALYAALPPPVSGSFVPAASIVPGSSTNHTHPTGNLTISNTEPGTTGLTGDTLSVQIELQVANWTAAWGTFNVTVPGSKATFYYGPAASAFVLFTNRQNVTVAGNGTYLPAAPTSLVLPTDLPFDAAVASIFSSNLLSVMTPFPTGTVNLSVRWEWSLSAPNGASSSHWSNWAVTTPAQDVWLVSFTGTYILLNSTYQVCVSGPLAGRFISLHIEVPSPVNDFTKTTEEVPAGYVAPFCLSVPVTENATVNLTPPEALLVHVWAYSGFPLTNATVTDLLYVINTECVTSLPKSGGGATLPTWLFPVGAVSAVAVGVAVTALVYARRWRRPPAAAVTSAPGPSGGGRTG